MNARIFYAVVLSTLCALGCATSGNLSKSKERKIGGSTYVIVGASSGIGRGMAEKLGAYKANVVLAARRTDLLEEVAQNIRAAGGNALVAPRIFPSPKTWSA